MAKRISWDNGNKGLDLDHVTDWYYDRDSGWLTVYLAAPAMVKGLDDQAVRKWNGAVARAIRDALIVTSLDITNGVQEYESEMVAMP